MRKVISAAEMRELDRLTTERYATPSLLLMEAAAASAARAIARLFSQVSGELSGRSALILCGRGNNGGDGAALARALCLAGVRVRLVLFGHVAEARGDALVNFEIARSLSGEEDEDEERALLRSAQSYSAQPRLAREQPRGTLIFRECLEISEWEEMARSLHSDDLIVDALFGTGLTRPLEGLHLRVVEDLNRLREERAGVGPSRPRVVSLDIPSGLNADLAEPPGVAVQADLTVTFTAPKPANVLPPASNYGGQLIVAPIGTPHALVAASPSSLYLTEESDARAWLARTRYAPGSFKNTHGHALVIAGSRGMTGAAALCGNAAMRAGAGLVTIATPASAQGAVAAQALPEVMTAALPETASGALSFAAFEEIERLTARADLIAIGPGLTASEEETRRLVRRVVEERRVPVVIDADGLNALAPWPEDLRGTTGRTLILTPHPGEMLRLLGTEDRRALADRVEAARQFASTHALLLVLKGSRTLVAGPDGRVFINPTGNAGLGTAGAGDTLTGIIAGFNAQAFASLKDEADALAATRAAVYVGGVAGDFAAREKGMRAMTASDIREHLGAAICSLDEEGEAP